MEVPLFKYSGRILSSSDNYCTAVEQNMRRVWGKWGRMVKILGREGVDRRTAGIFYVEMVQSVLLFGSETWVVTPQIEKSLTGSHHWAIRKMTAMGPERQLYGTWLYPPIGAALAMVGLYDIGVYIACRQNTVAQ